VEPVYCLDPIADAELTSVPEDTEGVVRPAIAVQCCDVQGSSFGCYRQWNAQTNQPSDSNDDCISGRSSRPDPFITLNTYSEAVAMCEGFGLALCEQPCGAGCLYDRHPTYSSLSCELGEAVVALARARLATPLPLPSASPAAGNATQRQRLLLSTGDSESLIGMSSSDLGAVQADEASITSTPLPYTSSLASVVAWLVFVVCSLVVATWGFRWRRSLHSASQLVEPVSNK